MCGQLPIRINNICPNHSYCVVAFVQPLAGTHISSLCDPILLLGRLPRLSLRLLPLTGLLRILFVLCTAGKGADNLPIRTDNICLNHSYWAACHCSTTGDVALDACNSKQNSLGTYFPSLCDPKWQLGRPARISRRLHPHLEQLPWFCITIWTPMFSV